MSPCGVAVEKPQMVRVNSKMTRIKRSTRIESLTALVVEVGGVGVARVERVEDAVSEVVRAVERQRAPHAVHVVRVLRLVASLFIPGNLPQIICKNRITFTRIFLRKFLPCSEYQMKYFCEALHASWCFFESTTVQKCHSPYRIDRHLVLLASVDKLTVQYPIGQFQHQIVCTRRPLCTFRTI